MAIKITTTVRGEKVSAVVRRQDDEANIDFYIGNRREGFTKIGSDSTDWPTGMSMGDSLEVLTDFVDDVAPALLLTYAENYLSRSE